MPSRRPASTLAWLLRKEWRELMLSRSWWVFLTLIGPLVGVTFIGAVQAYAEASGLNGTALGVGEAFSPLIGVWAPTFSACEIGAAFLLPFVAIRLVAGDRQSGALKLELQGPASSLARVGAKALVLLAGWLIASIPPLIGVLLWKWYGGSTYAPELATVVLGHVLNAGLTIALAAAAAAVTEHPSTAAILTLSVTVGTWIVNFIAAVHGGLWERVAGYTPTAMVAEFQHGLVRLSVVLVASLLVFTGLGLAAIWMRLGVAPRRRLLESTVFALVSLGSMVGATQLFASWDFSENRANSFAKPDELALRGIQAPLRIRVHLASEDPRRVDLDRHALTKLRRIVRRLDVEYVAATSIGLFEQTAEHYGEIHYDLGGRTAVSRSTTVEGVLETIYSLADVSPPGTDDDVFRGHPLPVAPRGAAPVFYGAWPAVVLASAALVRRRLR
ncbi:MAG: hypothetical protein U0Q12_11270 [Vicinamibacterales bacterium]